MPHLFKKSFVRPKSAPSSQKTKISSFKTPLLAKENIDKILQLKETVAKEKNPTVYYSLPSLKTFEKDQIIASSASNLERKKRNVLKTTQLQRTLSNASSISVHLSFEDATGKVIDDSDRSDISNRMNEPKIKDAYLQFVKKLSQSSNECKLTSSPKTQESIVVSPVAPKSPELFTTPEELPLERINNTDEQLITGNDHNSQKFLSSKENKKAPRKIKKPLLNQNNENSPSPPKKAKKNDNKTVPNKKRTARKSKQSQEKISLSQEILNRTDVKAAYVKFMKSSLENETDTIKPRKATKRKKKYVIRSSSEESLDTSLEKVRKTKGKPAPKRSKIHKKKSEETDNEEEYHNGMTTQERMALIQESRNVGLYVLCDICNKARYLPNVKDPLDLPDKWYCAMHPDDKYNKCSYPEEILEDKEYLIDNLYNAGSIVWAKMHGYPWWPAMVEDDVDTETYFWLDGNSNAPTWYHVTFFDSADITRAWMRPSCLKPFKTNMNNPKLKTLEKNKYYSRVSAGFEQAVDAIRMPLIDRLKKYSFIYRCKKALKATKGKTSNVPKRAKEKQGNKIKKLKKRPNKEVSRAQTAAIVGSLQNQPVNDIVINQDGEMPPNADDISIIINDLNWEYTQNLSFTLLD